ncbi:MAG: CoA-binding protein [Bacteroidales bacterium]|nr:CoA-binding protein [Bacteroidales bacterium]
MTKLSSITEFLAPKKMALIGFSRNPQKTSRAIYKELSQKGFEFYPVNPNSDEIDGIKCYKSISELPTDVDRAYIVTPKVETKKVLEELYEKGIKKAWIHISTDTPEAVEYANKNDFELIYKRCVFMFAEPVTSVHSFHRFFVKLFGKYPK